MEVRACFYCEVLSVRHYLYDIRHTRQGTFVDAAIYQGLNRYLQAQLKGHLVLLVLALALVA